MAAPQQSYEERLGELLERLNRVHRGFGFLNEVLINALGGLHSDFKAAKFVVPWHAELMADKEKLNTGNSDKAGFLAEAMVKSVHCCADHLAIVVMECGFATEGKKGQTYLAHIQIADPELRAKVSALQKQAGWRYIRNFTNTSKHQGYIGRAPVRGENCYEMEFEPFPKGKSAKRLFSTIVRYVDELLAAIVDILDWVLERQPATTLLLPEPLGSYTANVCATTTVYPLELGSGISVVYGRGKKPPSGGEVSS